MRKNDLDMAKHVEKGKSMAITYIQHTDFH